MTSSDPRVRCTVSVRVPTGQGTFRFERMAPHASQRGEVWELMVPPQIGDLVFVSGNTWRVVDRMWRWPEYGSVSWPHGHQDPVRGPALDLIVEAADGLYVHEAVEADR